MDERASALAALVLLGACLASAACDRLLPQRSEGERLWRSRCARCHGIDAAGNTPRYLGNAAADLRDDDWRHGGAYCSMAQLVRDGIPGAMPPNPDLSPGEVQAVVRHLRQLRGEAVGTP